MKTKTVSPFSEWLLLSKQRRVCSLPYRWCVPGCDPGILLYGCLIPCNLSQKSLEAWEIAQNLRRILRDHSEDFLLESWNLPSVSLIKRLFIMLHTFYDHQPSTPLNKAFVLESWQTRQCASSVRLRCLLSSIYTFHDNNSKYL